LGDTHIGAWRDPKLKEMNMQAFLKALDECVNAKVDFIIISGDLFDTTLPDLAIVKRAVEEIKKVKDSGIEFYLTYGSHDFAANSTSIVDILNSSGLFRKVVNAETRDDKIYLKFTVDGKTGAKLTGMSGRRLSLERNYYGMLDIDSLEAEDGFKIFVFHNAIMEIRPSSASYPEGVPLSSFPKGFDYYAGGHVHERLKHMDPKYGVIAFPGCLFASTFTDLEITARGEKRGFFIVDFEDKITNAKFVEVKVADVYFKEIDATKKTVYQLTDILHKTVDEIDVKGRITLLKVTGELLNGKPSDINFNEIKQALYRKGASVVHINHHNLSTEEKLSSGQVTGENRAEIEEKILSDMVKTFKIDPALKKTLKIKLEKVLCGKNGLQFASDILNALKLEKNEGETKTNFEERVLKNTLHLLSLEADN
jgi:exonuclease SbcD